MSHWECYSDTLCLYLDPNFQECYSDALPFCLSLNLWITSGSDRTSHQECYSDALCLYLIPI